jgi:signal transduction histidine kinase
VLYRRAQQWLGGVAGGIADHIGVSVRWVRLAFIILTISGGLGVVLYAAFWIVLPQPPGAVSKGRLPSWLKYGLAGVGAIGALFGVGHAYPLGRLYLPAALSCLGGALIWRQATESQRERWLVVSRSSLAAKPRERIGLLRLAVGAALVVLGAATVLARANLTAARDGLVAFFVTLVGVGLISGPWWIKMVGELTAERRERIRSQERADLAARLHDSVLQTLALIQRNADSPREVTRLARGQERELRTLLYGEPSAAGRFGTALAETAAEIEDSFRVTVEVVVVGDAALDDRLRSLVAATREALVNAAKHAGVATMSLYAEVEAEDYTVFVRDRGIGFELDEIGADRQGIRGSIIGRIERHGGQVWIRSGPAIGTEVELRMSR